MAHSTPTQSVAELNGNLHPGAGVNHRAGEANSLMNEVPPAKEAWTDHVTGSIHTTNPSKFWRLLRSLSSKCTNPLPTNPLATHKIYRKIHKRHKLDQDFRPFDERQVHDAIKTASNSTVTGPEKMTNLHL